MSAVPWVKWYAGDFLNGIAELEPNEIAVYAVILNRIYDEGGPIPDDTAKIARRCNMRPTSCQKAVDALVAAGKLRRTDGHLTNRRAENELKSRQEVSDKSSRSASARWGKRDENKNNINDDAMRSHSDRTSSADAYQKPEPDSTDPGGSVPRERWPADAFEQFWARYPAKVGKVAASTAFAKVSKSSLVAFAALMAGLDAYVRHKPPDRDWCYPTTWLNQGRWDDEWTDGQPQQHRNGTGAGGGRKPTAHENLLAGFAAVAARHDRGGDVVPEARPPPGPAGAHAGPTLELEARRGVDPRDDAPWPDAGDHGGRGAAPHRFPGH